MHHIREEQRLIFSHTGYLLQHYLFKKCASYLNFHGVFLYCHGAGDLNPGCHAPQAGISLDFIHSQSHWSLFHQPETPPVSLFLECSLDTLFYPCINVTFNYGSLFSFQNYLSYIPIYFQSGSASFHICAHACQECDLDNSKYTKIPLAGIVTLKLPTLLNHELGVFLCLFVTFCFLKDTL